MEEKSPTYVVSWEKEECFCLRKLEHFWMEGKL